MSKKKIRWGILGTSFISEVMAKAIHESTISELVAIGSRSSVTAKSFADSFSIPKYYDDYHMLVNDEEIDAVYIGLPNHAHKEWIIHAAKAGKHILCEKPFVISADEAREVISIVEKSNVFCMEALMYRCHPFTNKIKELIQSKIIGEIRLYNAVYTANIADIANPVASGAIRNLGCYPISLIRLLENSEPTSVQGAGRINPNTQSDNQASCILTFKNNVMATVSTADDIEMFWQFDVYGTEGHLKLISNPWLPNDNNHCIILRNDETKPIDIYESADKSLYTYQIDTVSNTIINNNFSNHHGISLQDSLGNITVLEKWFNQVKQSHGALCLQ